MVEHRKPEDRDNAGRDHHPNAYSMWMAGGGIQGGQVVGKTDDFCLNITEDPVHIHDLQATILHCLGFDHKRLTYRHMGREFPTHRCRRQRHQQTPHLIAPLFEM